MFVKIPIIKGTLSEYDPSFDGERKDIHIPKSLIVDSIIESIDEDMCYLIFENTRYLCAISDIKLRIIIEKSLKKNNVGYK